MNEGDVIHFLAVREDLEAVACNARVLALTNDEVVTQVEAPEGTFGRALQIQLLKCSLVREGSHWRYLGTFHGGILVPSIHWIERSSQDAAKRLIEVGQLGRGR